MQQLHATQAASISELKQNPSRLINEAEGQPIVILNHNTPAAYLIPAETFELMLDYMDEIELKKTVQARLSDGSKSIKVNLDDL
jgi:antitoxin StbD